MKAVRIQSQGALRTAERTQNLNIIIWPHKSYGKYREHRLLNLILVNRYVCLYFPVARLMAVEDELRGGAIPDIKPRILTDQVCACVYIFLSSLLAKPVMSSNSLHHSCITSRAFAEKVRAAKSCTPPVLIFQKYTSMSQHFTIRFTPLKGAGGDRPHLTYPEKTKQQRSGDGV